MANPFAITPANPLQALMAFDQSYQGARKRTQEDEASAALQQFAQSNPQLGPIAQLIGSGNVPAAQAIATIERARAQDEFQRAESSRNQSNADRSYQLQVQQFSKPPAGYQQAPGGGGLTHIPGGPEDPSVLAAKPTRQNVPPGYRYSDPKDPNSPLQAIPGGPAEKIEAETAGRLGLARSFLGQLQPYKDASGKEQKGIKDRIRAGEVTGPVDAAAAAIGRGKPGELRRLIESGSEALLRNLTGAGMNKEEAGEYTRRYKPSPLDDVPTLLSKVDQLERELQYVIETVGKGRGLLNRQGSMLGGGEVIVGDGPVDAPKPGQVMDGYRFRGGDPAKQENWIKVQ